VGMRKAVAVLVAGVWCGSVLADGGPQEAAKRVLTPAVPLSKLTAPSTGRIPVAFVLTKGAVMIDFAGPWEVFQDVHVPTRAMDDQMPFELYTVSDTKDAIRTSGGMQVVPDHTFDDAPQPRIIVIPAQGGESPRMLEWIRQMAPRTDVIMSVCTGAFVLGGTGLLAGKEATTHHSAYKTFAVQFPDVRLERGVRFVDNGNVATAGGLSSGVDLALHVVERYFGREVATSTAYQMEYQGQGWLHPESNAAYAKRPVSTAAHPLCPVCDMEVDPASAPKSVFGNKTYYFCSADDKATFDAAPQKWIDALK
jgi:putative intracellular protease/amidase/YHS domain-containing protein